MTDDRSGTISNYFDQKFSRYSLRQRQHGLERPADLVASQKVHVYILIIRGVQSAFDEIEYAITIDFGARAIIDIRRPT